MSMDGSVNGAGSSGSQNKGYQNDTLNPYFLHPNENPNLVLVSTLLSGANYHSWSRAMTMALKSKNKIHFIDGALPRPNDDDRDSLAWDRCNTMLMSWLNNAVEPEISQSILWMDSALEIWLDLKERFYQGDVFRISDIQEEIFSLKQGDSTISTYFTKMKKLWQELDNFRPIPTTNCVVNCDSVVIAKMKSYRDSDQVIRFLKGLNEQYSVVRSQIMLIDPLPSITKVYSLLVQQERQLILPIDESKLLAVSRQTYYAGRGSSTRDRGSARGGRFNGGRGKGNKLCTHCGQTNHVVENCWRKYGVPPHMQHLLGNGAANQGNGAANNSVNIGGDDEDIPIANYDEGNNDNEQGKFFFIADQHKALLALLQGSSSSSSHSLNHVTTNSDMLHTDIPSSTPSTSQPTPISLSTIPDTNQSISLSPLDNNPITSTSPTPPSTSTSTNDPSPTTQLPIDNPIRKSLRISHPPGYLQDYHCNLITSTSHQSSAASSSSSQCKFPLSSFISYTHLSDAHKHYILNISTLIEPNTYEEAMCDEHWKTAINVELTALLKNKTWDLVTLPPHKKAIGYVNTAFLHGDLNEEVYMKPPPSLPLAQPDLVCKLQRSLYGLKQASRQWNAKFTETLISSGYVQSKADYSLFTKQSTTGFTAILVYVDDLVLGGTDIAEIHHLKALLDAKFSIKDLGSLKYFLGFEVARSTTGISLCQRKYTLDLLQDSGLLAAKPTSTPMQPQLQLHKSSGALISAPTTYRRLIGRLLYLTHTRPEISYAVSKLSQFLDSPTDSHMLAGLHILKYLKNNPGQGLFFSSSSPLSLRGYSDSDWGACPDTRRSTTGTKHIEIDCHVVRDKVQANIVQLLPVSSKDQIADIFTKSLHPGPFHTLHDKLGTIDIHSSLRGTVDSRDVKSFTQ
ncbi:hypothetical protein TSUD_360250 [Trifolium subterraneum]|uniref:Reverse transcriptase Ty1/copia-type domain-containing protein n=1 Tax=Trifolium subterraneum TaxID=3900 RepID=A0A2Z6MZD6_TRISU|nr:hypothetical protein TSUD_360250 [Trifolium subterraneum]